MKIAWIAYFTSNTKQPPLAGRHPFLMFTQIQSSHLKTAWISSPMRWLRSNSSPAKVIHSQNYSMTYTIYQEFIPKFDFGYTAALSFLFQLSLVIVATIYVRRVMADYSAPAE